MTLALGQKFIALLFVSSPPRHVHVQRVGGEVEGVSPCAHTLSGLILLLICNKQGDQTETKKILPYTVCANSSLGGGGGGRATEVRVQLLVGRSKVT